MEPGTKLGHYEISKLLGKGEMGEVWRARDTKLGRDCCLIGALNQTRTLEFKCIEFAEDFMYGHIIEDSND